LKKMKALLMLFITAALTVTLVPQGSAKATTQSQEDSSSPRVKVISETEKQQVLEIDGEKVVSNFDTSDPNVNVVEVIEEDGTKTTFEFNEKTQTLLKNGKVDENLVIESSEKPSTKTNGLLMSSDIGTMAVPSGGTFVGKFNYSYNMQNVSLAVAANAISALTRIKPVSVITGILSTVWGFSSTAYYTVYQYRYAKKCNAYPYANHAAFFANYNRTQIIAERSSAKFFMTRPTPSSCTP
jgi:hypothetical protein